MKCMVTGSNGFIAGYLIEELLDAGHEVIGIDNLSKYGEADRSYNSNRHYTFVKEDVKNTSVMKELLADCDHLIAGAAMIGGISYFHSFAYDLLAENERIAASSFDAAIHAFQNDKLKKITVVSSSMVFENTTVYPTPEGRQLIDPPPSSTYGFQKLALEYFAQGAQQQYGLPYTIVRPFNAVGIGEKKAISDVVVKSGNIELALSHVVPDLVQKILKGQQPLHILGSGSQVRHYTYGGDLARGIRLAMEYEGSDCEDFNLSTAAKHNVKELSAIIWEKIKGSLDGFELVHDDPFQHDVENRSPNVEKAKEVLGFEATTTIEEALDEIIPWIEHQLTLGKI